MTPEQYEEFLDDLRVLRRVLGLPSGALPVSPRVAFLECIGAADQARAALAAAEQERDRYRETLGHYADAANWSESREGMWDDYYDAPGNGYDVARAALAGHSQEETR